jgi:hypothetical protein
MTGDRSPANFKEMIRKNHNSATRERLEQLGREVLRVASSNEEEAEAAARSPFLYSRLSARIAAERARRAEGERWLAVLGVAWRGVPALALVFIFALGVLMTSAPVAPAQAGVVDEALSAGQPAVYERVVFADRAALTGDDVLTTILEEGPEAQR